MEYVLLGWSEDGPTLHLDHERFSYAGKFVMSQTGKAVAREPPDEADTGEADAGEADTDETETEAGGVAGAIAFSEDRTDPTTLWLRYVTVRADRRGDGIGPRLAAFVAERAEDRGYDRLRIAVNNPFAYEALYRAGFGYTGEETGIAELVCERPPPDPSTERYRAGLDVFRERDLSAAERRFLDERRGADPPAVVDAPT